MHIFSSSRNGCRGLSRAFTAGASRCIVSLTVSAPRLSDLLSNSRSGDAADWQVACGSMLWQRRFVSSLELRRARPADGDTSAVCGPRASAMRPRRVAVGYRPRERSANDDRRIVMAVARCTITAQRTCDCESESGSARPLKCFLLVCGRMDRCIQQYLKQYVSVRRPVQHQLRPVAATEALPQN